jgi:hypothetical protein
MVNWGFVRRRVVVKFTVLSQVRNGRTAAGNFVQIGRLQNRNSKDRLDYRAVPSFLAENLLIAVQERNNQQDVPCGRIHVTARC